LTSINQRTANEFYWLWIGAGDGRAAHRLRTPYDQVTVMKIHFPDECREYCARDFVVAFSAEVGVPRVQCAKRICSPRSNRLPIERATRNIFNEIGANLVLMHSGYFRFCD